MASGWLKCDVCKTSKAEYWATLRKTGLHVCRECAMSEGFAVWEIQSLGVRDAIERILDGKPLSY